jgi:hypothetical protein
MSVRRFTRQSRKKAKQEDRARYTDIAISINELTEMGFTESRAQDVIDEFFERLDGVKHGFGSFTQATSFNV